MFAGGLLLLNKPLGGRYVLLHTASVVLVHYVIEVAIGIMDRSLV